MSRPAAESAQHPPSGEDEGEGRIGLFPSWRALYATVVVYGVVVILILYILTIVLGSGSL